MFLAFRICARPIFSENGKDIFLFGVLPVKIFGQCGGANADSVLRKLFFGERICQNFGSFVFEFGCRKWKRRGLGRNFPFAPLFSFGEIRAGYSKILTKPLFASTSIRSPSFNNFVAVFVPIMHGFFISRETMAAWHKIPPSSVTNADAFSIAGI